MDDSAAAIAPGLLAFLRESLNDPAVDYLEPPTPIAGGFETAIYTFRLRNNATLPSPLVLRVFRAHEDPIRAAYEKAVHKAIAGMRYPVPSVHLASADTSVLGGGFVIMDRVAGSPLLEDFLRLRTFLRLRAGFFGFVARTLASLQLRLHALDSSQLEAALAAEGVPAIAEPGRISQRALTYAGQLDLLDYRIGSAQLDGLRPGLAWLRERQPAPGERVICHGDFHPLNIMSLDGGVTGVIDWPLVTIADAAFDVGSTMMLLNLAPSSAPAFVRRSTASRYLKAYRKQRPLEQSAIGYYEAYRCLRSLTWAGESRQAEAGVIADCGDNPWHPPEVAARLTGRFAKISGVTVSLP